MGKITYPGAITHGNPDYPIAESFDIKGGAIVVNNLDERKVLSANKLEQYISTVCVKTTPPTYYLYTGTNPAYAESWTEILPPVALDKSLDYASDSVVAGDTRVPTSKAVVEYIKTNVTVTSNSLYKGVIALPQLPRILPNLTYTNSTASYAPVYAKVYLNGSTAEIRGESSTPFLDERVKVGEYFHIVDGSTLKAFRIASIIGTTYNLATPTGKSGVLFDYYTQSIDGTTYPTIPSVYAIKDAYTLVSTGEFPIPSKNVTYNTSINYNTTSITIPAADVSKITAAPSDQLRILINNKEIVKYTSTVSGSDLILAITRDETFYTKSATVVISGTPDGNGYWPATCSDAKYYWKGCLLNASSGYFYIYQVNGTNLVLIKASGDNPNGTYTNCQVSTSWFDGDVNTYALGINHGSSNTVRMFTPIYTEKGASITAIQPGDDQLQTWQTSDWVLNVASVNNLSVYGEANDGDLAFFKGSDETLIKSGGNVKDLYKVYSASHSIAAGDIGNLITHSRNTLYPLVSFLDSSNNIIELSYKVVNANQIRILSNKAVTVTVIVGGGKDLTV